MDSLQSRFLGLAPTDAVRSLGPTRLLRFFVLLMFVGAMFQTVTNLRADLARPTDLASDTGNYLAAGQRLNEGSPLYGLESGDHPVAQDNAPLWTVPLLSPPTIAVLWRPLALAPSALIVELWWLGGAIATSAAVLWLIARLPPAGLVILIGLVYQLAVVAWSGNVNAYILPALACVWPLSLSTAPWRRAMAGVLVAITGAVKLSPIILGAWFVLRRDRSAFTSMLATLLAVAALVVGFAGMRSVSAYLEIARATSTAGATPWSPTGWLLGLGVPESPARLGPAIVGVAALAAALLLRSRPRASFAALAAGAAFASPVARVETLAMLAVCLIPWTVALPNEGTTSAVARTLPTVNPARLKLAAATVIAGALAIAGVRASTSQASSLWIENDTDEPVIVRFYVNVVPASFGYVVPPGAGAWAWNDEPGNSDLEIVAYDASCTVIDRVPRARVASATVTVGDSGMRLAPRSGEGDSPARVRQPHLGYTHGCAGS